jgi:glucokinase
MKKILTADIGGTNSRFAYFQLDAGGTLSAVETHWLKTQKSNSFFHLLDQLKSSPFSLSLDQSDMAVFAIAGPVKGGVYSSPPNIPWDIDVLTVRDEFKLTKCLLINDFVAQAYACRSPIIKSAQEIVPGQIREDAALAVIGPGTGLGQAALIPDGQGGFLAVPSEGAHSTFPFETECEFEFRQFLLKELDEPYIETETVVSGSGLSWVHQFLTGEKLKPADVAKGLSHDSETLRWMARFYGRVFRNYALQVLATGGVYIAGGVVAKAPELVTHPEFRQEFRTSKTVAHVLEKIPVFLNSNEESGLWGAAMVATQKLSHRQIQA